MPNLGPALGATIRSAGARLGAVVLPETTAPEADELEDLRPTATIRNILEPLLNLLGYTIEEITASYSKVKYQHAIVINGNDRRFMIHIPPRFLDGEGKHNQKLFCIPYALKKTHGAGVIVYLFSEGRDVWATHCKEVFNEVWRDNCKITLEFVAWSQVKELRTSPEPANGQGPEPTIEPERLSELIETLTLLLGLKPEPQPIATLTMAERTRIIGHLTGYAKLGYDGEARRNFLALTGIDGSFADEKITLGAPGQFQYATCLVTQLVESPSAMKPLIEYMAKHDDTCPEATRTFLQELLAKYFNNRI